LAGFYFAYRWDIPVGPVDVALLGFVYGLVLPGKKILGVLRPKASDAASPSGVQM
jgi:ABC-type Mn2+/Zn2+ transport system permease subunit